MKRQFLLLLASVLCLAASPTCATIAISLSGTVTDSSGHPLPGASISLVVAGNTTSTKADGSWSISVGSTHVASRAVAPVPRTRHLVVDGDRIRLQFDGMDGVGRMLPTGVGAIHESPLPTANHGVAARAADAADVDTILVTWNGKRLVRLPIETSDSSGIAFRVDTAWSDDHGIPWNPRIAYGSLLDTRDGRTYRVVRIGSLTWMAENLAIRDTGSGGVPLGLCFQSSNDSCQKYGRLYRWTEAMGLPDSFSGVQWFGSGTARRSLCPSGWDLSFLDDWKQLERDARWPDIAVAALLRSATGWDAGTGNDSTGMRILPGGYEHVGAFNSVGSSGDFWTASEAGSDGAEFVELYSKNTDLNDWTINGKEFRFSVRCLLR